MSRPWASLDAFGNCSDFTKSLTVIRPPSRPSSSISGSRSRLCLRSSAVASSRAMPTGPVTSGIRVITSSTLVVRPLGDRGEPQVAVGDDAEQVVVDVDDRQTGHAVLATDPVEVLQRRVGADRDRVGDDPGLGPLHQVDLVGLVVERQVAVEHPEAALTGHRDRHPRLGDGVHRRAHQRRPQRDLAGQPAGGVDVAGRQVRMARQEQDVVVGETEGGELLRNLHEAQSTGGSRPHRAPGSASGATASSRSPRRRGRPMPRRG